MTKPAGIIPAASELLEAAKRAVEIEIESGETPAIEFLETV
jgi:hypothetical protein